MSSVNPPNATPANDAAPAASTPDWHKAFTMHGRNWQTFTYVYPVFSRRSAGLSVGINLNIDDACNFDCPYCLVDRTTPPKIKHVDPAQLETELHAILAMVTTGEIWRDKRFVEVPVDHQRLNDIAFSGNGEPTTYPHFEQAVETVISAKQKFDLAETKIVVITNATMFHKPNVKAALARLDENQGEIWAKLDAADDELFPQVNMTRIPHRRIVDNILACGQERPIVIQSLFMQLHGKPTPPQSFERYLDCIESLLTRGCQIDHVQLYTTARTTAKAYVSPLTNTQLDEMNAKFRKRLPDVPTEVYYGIEHDSYA